MQSALFYLTLLYFCAQNIQDVLCKSHSSRSKSSDGKIVGGYSTSIQNVPYQVYLLLQKGNQFYQCGGSIISSRYVLTAAHCLTGVSRAYVRAGSTQADSGGQMYVSSLITRHPSYNSATSDYDVGVIRLSSDITIDNNSTKVVELASSSTTVQPGTELLVSGWGTTSEDGEVSENLMAVKVPTVSTEDCRKSYGRSITARMICAGQTEGGKDSCQGDSGGPAVLDSNSVQVGIVSFGNGCARKGYPGVYTKVSAVRTWIRLSSGV